jgi:hypothetical protein
MCFIENQCQEIVFKDVVRSPCQSQWLLSFSPFHLPTGILPISTLPKHSNLPKSHSLPVHSRPLPPLPDDASLPKLSQHRLKTRIFLRNRQWKYHIHHPTLHSQISSIQKRPSPQPNLVALTRSKMLTDHIEERVRLPVSALVLLTQTVTQHTQLPEYGGNGECHTC